MQTITDAPRSSLPRGRRSARASPSATLVSASPAELREERGQIAAEYMGLLFIVALIIGAHRRARHPRRRSPTRSTASSTTSSQRRQAGVARPPAIRCSADSAVATFRPGARLARSGAFACLGLVRLRSPAAPPRRRRRTTGPSVLLVLDASRSMRAPAGRRQRQPAWTPRRRRSTRCSTPCRRRRRWACASTARASPGQGRAKACADTELVAPVEAGDREALRARGRRRSRGKGRTPIGRSLLATPGDFADDGRRHQVILVSDGLDNCAPPEPCAAARRVARAAWS